MRKRLPIALLLTAGVFLVAALTDAQPPQGKGKGKKDGGGASEGLDLATYMMSFNKAKDGKLTKEELTDTRLHRLFDRADTNKDGVVTREELTALVALLAKEDQGGPGDFKGPGGKGPGGKGKGTKGEGKGKGDFGDPKGKGKGDFDPQGKGDPKGKDFGKGFGGKGAPRPGQILTPFLQETLELTDAQKKELAALQAEVDARLDKLLTEEQRGRL